MPLSRWSRITVATAEGVAGDGSRIYLIALGVSLVGNSAITLVAGIWVKALTGSSSVVVVVVVVVSVCVYAPSLLGPITGMVAAQFAPADLPRQFRANRSPITRQVRERNCSYR